MSKSIARKAYRDPYAVESFRYPQNYHNETVASKHREAVFDRRRKLRAYLSSVNPMRNNINYSEEEIFFLEILSEYSLNHGLTRTYNEAIKNIASFFAKRYIANGKKDAIVSIGVKYKGQEDKDRIGERRRDGDLPLRSSRFPHHFLRNKNIDQHIVFQLETGGKKYPLFSVPLMIGSEWCATHNLSPLELHQSGENAVNGRGYFIIDGTSKYFLAHQKVAHNIIATVYDEKTQLFNTSLKIQDERNNSVETFLKKRVGKKKNEGEDDKYILEVSCFNNKEGHFKYEANKIFKQIFILIRRLQVENKPPTYEAFMRDVSRIITGKLGHFLLFDWKEPSDEPIKEFLKPGEQGMKQALINLYKNKERREMYEGINEHLVGDIKHFPEMVINSIFPSISPKIEPPHKKPTDQAKYDAYRGKAFLLMEMIFTNILIEQGVRSPADRDNIGNKTFLSAAEIFRRDLTRDNGRNAMKLGTTPYKPNPGAAKGEEDVFEMLDQTNHLQQISSETVCSIPRSKHSQTFAIRDVHASHTGLICPFETPSAGMVGLKTHMACTAMLSVAKNIADIERIVGLIATEHMGSLFGIPNQEETQRDDTKKLIRINSAPFALIDEKTYEIIRAKFKRDYRTMDMAIIKDTYTEEGRNETMSYNIICDGGRMYRPLYVSRELITTRIMNGVEYTLLEKDSQGRFYRLNDYIRGKTFEDMIEDGIIETVFPDEMENDNIASGKNELIELLAHNASFQEQLDKMEQQLDERLEALTEAEGNTERERVYKEAEKILKKMKDIPRFCEIDPVAIYGVASACAPMFNHNPGGRCSHESAMVKSALTQASTNAKALSETSAKVLHGAEHAAVSTKVNELNSTFLCNGINTIMAICIQEENVEDGYLASESLARSLITERIITIEVVVEPGEKTGLAQNVSYKAQRYHDIDTVKGLPRVGTHFKAGDCIFAKYKIEMVQVQTAGGKIQEQPQVVDKSKFIEEGKDGYVRQIKDLTNENVRMYRITIAAIDTARVGNKVATRYSQKGVICAIRPDEEMPRIVEKRTDGRYSRNAGMIPGVIFSPLSLSSRATPGVIMELLLGNYAVATGQQVDASAFTVNRRRLEEYNDILVNEYDFVPWGVEEYEMPSTGTRCFMMTGVVHLRILKHTAVDKQKACGPIKHTIDKGTRQPSKGGANGAIRLGYMDFNTLSAHSGGNLINSLFTEQSDRVLIELCENCGHLCDRCNKDPDTMRNPRDAVECPKCGEHRITTTQTSYGAVSIAMQLASVGIKLSLFPGSA